MSGLLSRLGLILINYLTLIPVYGILLTSAILSSNILKKVYNFSDTSDNIEKVKTYIKTIARVMWGFFIGTIIFTFTLGFFIIPWVMNFPYFYGAVMIGWAIINLIISIYIFYIASLIKSSTDYTDGTDDATKAFRNTIIMGILMLFTSIFLVGYSIWSIRKYRKGGGLTGDIGLGLQAATAYATGGTSAVLPTLLSAYSGQEPATPSPVQVSETPITSLIPVSSPPQPAQQPPQPVYTTQPAQQPPQQTYIKPTKEMVTTLLGLSQQSPKYGKYATQLLNLSKQTGIIP